MCASGMINSWAFSRRARPQGPGDEDAVKWLAHVFRMNFAHSIINMATRKISVFKFHLCFHA